MPFFLAVGKNSIQKENFYKVGGKITVSSDITAQPAVGYTVNTYANIK